MTDAVARAAELAALGFTGTLDTEQLDRLDRAQEDDPDPRVRSAALAALVRGAPGDAFAAWQRATSDPEASVRRRAAELAPALASAHRSSAFTAAACSRAPRRISRTHFEHIL